MGTHTDTDSTHSMDPLPTPATQAGRDRLAAILAHPGKTVVGLDFDGTLAPIVPDPEQARAHPEAVPALAALAPKIASVAVVTGRPAGVAVRHGGFAGVAGLEHLVVLGHYGAERWDAVSGNVSAPAPTPASPPSAPNSLVSWTVSVRGRARGSRRRAEPSRSTPAAPATPRPPSRPCAHPSPTSPAATA